MDGMPRRSCSCSKRVLPTMPALLQSDRQAGVTPAISHGGNGRTHRFPALMRTAPVPKDHHLRDLQGRQEVALQKLALEAKGKHGLSLETLQG